MEKEKRKWLVDLKGQTIRYPSCLALLLLYVLVLFKDFKHSLSELNQDQFALDT